jgi:hypothetical protein
LLRCSGKRMRWSLTCEKIKGFHKTSLWSGSIPRHCRFFCFHYLYCRLVNWDFIVCYFLMYFYEPAIRPFLIAENRLFVPRVAHNISDQGFGHERGLTMEFSYWVRSDPVSFRFRAWHFKLPWRIAGR